MATVVNTRDVLLLAASPRLLWTGVQGIKVAVDSSLFKINNSGVSTPSTINFTATLNGVSGTVVWTVILGSATLSSSVGLNTSLPHGSMSSDTITVRASVSYGGVTYSDSVSISKVVDGATGANGSAGATGSQGASSRIAYTLIDGSSLSASPSSVTLTGDVMPTTGTWGETRAWTTSPSSPSAGQAVFQTTGTYNPTTNQIVWVTPYLSNLKVGELSAIVMKTGTLEVDTAGYIRGGQTNFNTGNGFWLGYVSGEYKFSVGNSSSKFFFDGSNLKFSGYGGEAQIGSAPAQTFFSISRTLENAAPAVRITDTASSNAAALNVTSNSTAYAVADFNSSHTRTLSAYCSNSGFVAGIFKNTSSSKTVSLSGGAYSVYSGSGEGKIYAVDGFTPFTGVHNSFITKDAQFELGDIVSSKQVLLKHDISNMLLEVEVSSKDKDKKVFGVISSKKEIFENYLDLDETLWYNYWYIYDYISVNGVGEGCINVCGINGNIEAGDYITTCSISGKGAKQDSDTYHNYTVAKSTEDVKFDYPEQVKQIACVYLCS